MANLFNKIFGYKEFHFSFIGKKKLFYIIALIVIVPGLLVTLFSGLNAGIEFTGGVKMIVTYTADVDIVDVREAVSPIVKQTPTINESTNNNFSIRTESLGEEDIAKIVSALAEIGPLEAEKTTTTSIGPTVGKELLSNARWALLIACALMLAYITIRFKFNYAVTAIISLLHDVLVIVSIFAILRIEVDSAFIAAILTTIGYSINNTIIIFDRIRENANYYPKKDFAVLINESINQTLTRNINTILAVLFLLAALLFFGGATTKMFILAMIIGVIAGFYSSVFIVGNLLIDITRFADKNKHSKKRQKSLSATKG